MNLVFIFFLAACGGGGGGGGSSEVPASSGGGSSVPISGSTQAIALTFSASSSDVELNGSVTLTWAGTNATSCDASGAWGGNNKAASGSESVNMTLVGTQTFSIVCKNSGDSVTASTSVEVYQIIGGTVLDGYIRGAEVFVDRNNNLTLDSNESSVTTDNNGSFSNLRGYNGQLIAKDGIDLDTGFIFENFSLTAKTATDKTDYIISPLTSVGYLLDTPSDINKIFGISDSIDVYSEDPVAKIAEPAFANLYSIGNKLTGLAMSVQTLEGNNKNLQDIFQTIATQAQNIFIETESSIQVDNNVLISNTLFNQLPTSMDADLRSDLGIAIGNSLYLLQVKDNKAATTGIQNFAFTTLQADLLKIQQLEAGVSAKYKEDIFNYVATDQNLSLSDVTVAITANDDSLNVNEDSQVMFLWSSIYSNDVFLRFADATASYVSPQNGSITNTDLEYFYTPNLNFNGTDSFSYKLEQGGQESVATVTITVNPVNDLPVLSGINNSYQKTLTYGAQAVGSLGVSDVDGDAFTYSLSGADASLFTIGSSGEISFNSAATDARTYNITVQVSDGAATVTQDLEITVNPNQSPVISCGNCSYALEYGSKNVGSISFSDEEGDAITYSLSGTDASLFSINESGAVSFNSNATDARTYDVTVIASDGISTAAEKNLSITVNPRDPNTTFTGVTSGFETFTGGSGDDTFNPGDGDARIDGGTYNDEVIFFSPRSEARIITLSGVTKVFFDCFSSYIGENKCHDYYITNVETLSFSDASVSLETALPASLISGSTTGNETLSGNSSDNVFDPGDGDATIDGGAGTDEVLFFSPRSEARIITLSGVTKVFFDCFSSYIGENKCHDYYITNVETLSFSDASVSLETALPASLISGSTTGNETLSGNSSDNVFDPGDGDATIDGGAGTDEVLFFSPRSEARIITLSGVTKVFFDCFSSYIGENKCHDYYITNVETLSFSDASVSLETALPASLISGSTTGNETLSGNSSDNVFDPGDGDATIDGGAGTDEVLFFSPRSEATISTISGISKITFDCFSSYIGENKCHTYDLTNIETVTFSDQSINLTTGWKQLGTDIDGLSQGDNSGYAVDISVGEVHGIIAAIGSPGASSDSSTSAWGSVRVLRKVNANADWEQFGYFEGEGAGDQFGRSVKLSADGTIIAVGGPNNDPTDVSDNAAGHVRVFQWIGGDQWTQLGTDIDGENQGDQSGDRIALSADGTILAVAEHLYLDNTGRVRIYRYENNTDWVLLGSPIVGEAKGDFFGTGLAINASGTRIAIGARANDSGAVNGGEVKVYEFSDGWVQLGSDISEFVSAGDLFGWGVSMNSAGDVIAAAAPEGTPKGELSGYVRVYRYNLCR
jgi:hypothetical protein